MHKFTLDPDNLPTPTLTLEQLDMLDMLDSLEDDDIDYSDIPELPENFYYER